MSIVIYVTGGSTPKLQLSAGNSSVMMNVTSGIKVDPDAPTSKRKREDDEPDIGP